VPSAYPPPTIIAKVRVRAAPSTAFRS